MPCQILSSLPGHTPKLSVATESRFKHLSTQISLLFPLAHHLSEARNNWGCIGSHSHPDVVRNCGFHLRWSLAHSFLFLEPRGLLWIFQLMRYGHKLFERIYWHFLLPELQVWAQHFYFEWLHILRDPPCCNLEHWHVHKRTTDL